MATHEQAKYVPHSCLYKMNKLKHVCMLQNTLLLQEGTHCYWVAALKLTFLIIVILRASCQTKPKYVVPSVDEELSSLLLLYFYNLWR